ncbi:hypothetical protein P691DRAFT_182039 [Macrolepiota fuliginosa MF-IS2]|uniref:Uncharacterized protein n=1 Tax=Macrolepiota fuliginosa MF-IS2 TaxID=1400762 RepID=A0A9P5XA64_9AGAR|nr:hypothetical protein P691DRAFT_182039 [Macrolepiota fuliginosa MF-IS2]
MVMKGLLPPGLHAAAADHLWRNGGQLDTLKQVSGGVTDPDDVGVSTLKSSQKLSAQPPSFWTRTRQRPTLLPSHRTCPRQPVAKRSRTRRHLLGGPFQSEVVDPSIIEHSDIKTVQAADSVPTPSSLDAPREKSTMACLQTWRSLLQDPKYRGRSFLLVVDQDNKLMLPVYTNEGSWLPSLDDSPQFCARAARAILNHAPLANIGRGSSTRTPAVQLRASPSDQGTLPPPYTHLPAGRILPHRRSGFFVEGQPPGLLFR